MALHLVRVMYHGEHDDDYLTSHKLFELAYLNVTTLVKVGETKKLEAVPDFRPFFALVLWS